MRKRLTTRDTVSLKRKWGGPPVPQWRLFWAPQRPGTSAYGLYRPQNRHFCPPKKSVLVLHKNWKWCFYALKGVQRTSPVLITPFKGIKTSLPVLQKTKTGSDIFCWNSHSVTHAASAELRRTFEGWGHPNYPQQLWLHLEQNPCIYYACISSLLMYN